MADTYFADEDEVRIELNKFMSDGRDDIPDNVIERAMRRADQLVNAKLKNLKIPTPTPNEVIEAATLYAVARGHDIIFADQENRSPTAIQNDKDAEAILEGYILENPESATGTQIDIFTVNGDTVEDESTDDLNGYPAWFYGL